MKFKPRCVKLILGLVIFVSSLSVLTLWAGGSGGVPDKRLVGQWQGQNRFGGMSYDEITGKKVSVQDVAAALNIAADGKVTGRIGGAELSDCVVKANRGWLGRRLHIKTDFIICGKVIGAVAPGSDNGTHLINAPFNLMGDQMSGTVFAIHGAFTYPYPILKLQLSR